MPSSSKKQHNFMEAIAHSPSFAKKVGIPQSVGKDFSAADKGHKFSKGGDVKKKMMMPMGAAAPMRKPMPPAMPPSGGMAPPMPPGGGGGAPPMGMKKGGSVKKMSSGGSASSRADGIASKGKTKGTQIKMAGGGKC
jgi:hypothetical protein